MPVSSIIFLKILQAIESYHDYYNSMLRATITVFCHISECFFCSILKYCACCSIINYCYNPYQKLRSEHWN